MINDKNDRPIYIIVIIISVMEVLFLHRLQLMNPIMSQGGTNQKKLYPHSQNGGIAPDSGV